MRKPDVTALRLRLPTGLHKLLTATAKRNNRSINSEILWCIAQQLGDEATKYVEHMKVEQRRIMEEVLRKIIADPQQAAEAIASFNKNRSEEP